MIYNNFHQVIINTKSMFSEVWRSVWCIDLAKENLVHWYCPDVKSFVQWMNLLGKLIEMHWNIASLCFAEIQYVTYFPFAG